MEKYLKKCKATNYGHCIIKEELIISDNEENEEVDVETVDGSIDDSFLKRSKRSRCIRNKNDARNNKQSTLDLFLKTKHPESNEQFENPNNVTNDENPKANVKPATSDNIDTLYKKIAKAHCPKCNVKRAVIRQKAHCRKCKTQLTYSCETCNKTYRTFTDLGYHLKTHHTTQRPTDNRQIHLCSVCNKTFAYRKGMLEHQRIQHGYVDESGGKKFKSKQEKVFYQCDNCPFTTLYKSNLTSHMLDMHMNFKKKCENCDKVFTNPRSMRRHLKVYCKKVKRIECHHCGHKFYRRDQVLNHLDQVHFGGSLTGNLLDDSPMSRICKYCDKSLNSYERMKCHLRRCESAPMNFHVQHVDWNDKGVRSCKYCGLEMKRYEHVRYHLDRCEFAPADCRLESEMADQPDLDTALKNLSKTYCENCKIKRPLKRRQGRCKKCEVSLKFICERCPKIFSCTKLLLNHLRVKHVKNKTFLRCDKCHSSYSHLKDLKFHEKTHHPSKLTTKMYKCSKCGKKYHREASLRKHRVSCGEEPKFSCDKCSYKTHFKSCLVDHFRAKKSTCI